MAFGNLSPDVVKNTETNFAGEALRDLNAQIVNERTIVKNKVNDAQTYDASPHFQKSREKMDGDPTPEEIKQAEDLFKIFQKMPIDKMNEFIKNNIKNWNKTVIQLTINLLNKAEQKNLKIAVNLEEQARAHKGSAGEEAEAADFEAARKYREKADANMIAASKISFFFKQALAKKILATASEKGVSDYREIPANSPLDSLVKRMKMEFKENSDGEIYVWINGKDTDYYMYPKDYTYRIYTLADNNDKANAIVFEETEKGKEIKSYKKFVIDEETSRVLSFNKDQNGSFRKGMSSFELPATTNSREKVVQN